MLFSAKHQRNNRVSATNKNKTLNKVSSISSSSSPSHSIDSQSHKTSLVTMEDVWQDINLGSIQSQHPQGNHEPRFGSHNHSHQNQNPNSIFQDFLNRPLNQEPTIPTMGCSSNGDTTTVTALFSSSPLPPPATVLSLNSRAGFAFLDNQDPLVTLNPNLHSHNHLNTPFEDLVASTCFGKKRGQESNEQGSGNRRNKRMIKNRESAARSRARKQECASPPSLTFYLENGYCQQTAYDLIKEFMGFDSHLQAYTNELELEVAHLQAENARLKRQQDQLKIAAANQQPKKNTLQRCSTAPF